MTEQQFGIGKDLLDRINELRKKQQYLRNFINDSFNAAKWEEKNPGRKKCPFHDKVDKITITYHEDCYVCDMVIKPASEIYALLEALLRDTDIQLQELVAEFSKL